LIAAAMSSIDSGINSIATVITVEWNGTAGTSATDTGGTHVRQAMALTLGAGLFITFAAGLLDSLPSDWSIIDLLPRTFNAITAPLGALFLIGMFLPRAGQRSVLIGALCGLATSIAIGYSKQFGLHQSGISFTWVMPCALFVALLSAWISSLFEKPASGRALAGLTWRSRHEPSQLTEGKPVVRR
jgi:Na+/proline symporter